MPGLASSTRGPPREVVLIELVLEDQDAVLGLARDEPTRVCTHSEPCPGLSRPPVFWSGQGRGQASGQGGGQGVKGQPRESRRPGPAARREVILRCAG